MKDWGDRLAEAVLAKRSPLVVGIDPRVESLPEPLRELGSKSWEDAAEAYAQFGAEVIDAVKDVAPAVKPQAAFFEQLGPAGMAALHKVIGHARKAGLLVILDGKRNDIGSTASGYAEAYLGADSPWGADSLTVSPYLGEDSLTPFVDICQQTHSGIFVLVKTSNPGGGLLQDIADADGATVYQHVAELVETMAKRTVSEHGYGNEGAVVGATYPDQLAELRERMPHAWLLIPGFGAQGGAASDVAAGFDERGLGAVVNSSRGVIFAYAKEQYAAAAARSWQDAVAAAAQDAAQALREAARLARSN